MSARLIVPAVLLLFAAVSRAAEIDGAWSLAGYEVGGKPHQELSGLLIAADGHFGIIYTMRSEVAVLSGRAHFGQYVIEEDEIVFDVQWWPEKMDGRARVAPPRREPAVLSLDNRSLELRFGSGSVQYWERVDDAEGETLASGVWSPAEAGEAGLVLFAENRFVLVSQVDAEDGSGGLHAYGGRVELVDGVATLNPGWAIEVAGDEGRIRNKAPAMRYQPSKGNRATLHGNGRSREWKEYSRLPAGRN